MVRGLRFPLLVVLALAFGSAEAQAARYGISFAPQSPLAGEQVSFHAERLNPGRGGGDSLTWDFGDGGIGTGMDPTHVYAAPGSYTVILRLTDSDGKASVADTAAIVVSPANAPPANPSPVNAPPSAAFSFTPASAVAGESISFVGRATDRDGDAVTLSWVFGDGGTATGAAPTHAYASAGSYTVVLTATDEHGASTATFKTLTVGPPGGTPPSGDPVTSPPNGTPPVMMQPFPVVRLAGIVLPRGALVRVLSVRAPRGAQLRVRCQGRGCPVRTLARTSATRIVRFRRFERRLPAGTTLEVFVRQRGKIGKYTRFLIRAGKAPSRVDSCLVPGRARPVRCR